MKNSALRNRLWLRLWLAFALVLAVAVVTAALIAHQSTSRAFDAFVARGAFLQQQRLQDVLARYYDRHGSWAGVGRFLDALPPLTDGPVVLVDPSGRLIARTEPGVDREAAGDSSSPSLAIRDRDGALVATALLPQLSDGSEPRDDRRTQDFVATLTRSLLLGGIVGGLTALLVSLVAARRLIQPIEALTGAVRRLGGGDLNQRVAESGLAEIGELSRAFNAMAAQLGRDQHLRQQFVADLTHELRSPLANVRGYLEALRDGVIEPRPEVLASVHEEAIQLQHLVEDLQELSLVEAGQLQLYRAPTDVGTLLEHAVSAARATALAKRIDLRIQPLPALPPVFADQQRVAQVLRNLLANAITYTPPGGSVTLDAWAESGTVTLAVRDTGPGIADADLPLIFERFYRTDQSRTRATGGVGLGLTIARQLVLAHGGSIEARSQLGQGTTLILTLPVAAPDPAQRFRLTAGPPDRPTPAIPY